jgi:WD40 repeat protein
MRLPNLIPSRLSLACLLLILAVVPALAADAGRTDAYDDPLPAGAVTRAGTIRWRAGAPVVLTAFLADGRSVLTVGQDRVAQVWDTATGRELRHFDVTGAPGGGAVRAPLPFSPLYRGVAVSADGKTLATTSADGAVRLWDVDRGKEAARLDDEAGLRTIGLALSADGKLVAKVSLGPRITVCETATGKVLKQFGEAPAPGAARKRLTPYCTEFGPDGKTLLQMGIERGNGPNKAVVLIWDVEDGKELKRFDELPVAGGPVTSALHVVTVSPDHKLLALPLDARTIVLLDPLAGKEVRRIEGAGDGRRGVVAFTADGKSLVVVDGREGRAAVCDVATGKVAKSAGKLEAAPFAFNLSAGRAGSGYALSADGRLLAWAGGPALHLFDLTTGKDRAAGTGHTAAVSEVRFSAAGKSLLTFSDDNSTRRWDAATGKEAITRGGGPRLSLGATLSPDGKVWALREGDGAVLLLDAETGQELRTLKPEPPLDARDAVFSPDSRTVALASPEEQMVRLYDVATGKAKRQLALPAKAGDDDFFRSRRVHFSADGALVAATDVNLHVWDTATGREVRVLPVPEGTMLRHFAFSPDRRALAMELGDGEIDVIELASGKPRLVLNARPRPKPDPDALPLPPRSFVVGGSTEPVSLAFAPDGRLLAQTGEDDKVHLWDVRTGQEAATFDPGRGHLTAVAFSADGKRLASASTDTTALVWDAEAVRKKLPNPAAPLAAEKAEALWEGLASGDAGRAYEAVRGLAGDGGKAVPLLRERLKPAAAPDARMLDKLIADLDADEFDTREKARKELEQLGEPAAGALRAALKNKPSAEVKRTIDELLAGLGGAAPSDERLRQARAVEALELIGTPEAVAVLKSLAGGAADAYLTTQARAALERLGQARK